MAQKSFTGNIGTPSGGFGLYLLIDYSQSIEGNYTLISRIRGYVKRNNSSYGPYNSSSSVTAKVAGVSYTASGAYDLRSDGYKLIIDKSPNQKIYHSDAGKLSAAFSLSMNGKLSSYYPNGTISKTVPFPDIPRVSDISLDVSTVPADGSTQVIATATKKSSSFTDELTVSLGAYSQDITSGTAFTIPTEWINAITGTSATAKVTVTTKNGATTVGSKSVNLTVTVPDDAIPTIDDVAITEAVAAVTTAFGDNFVKILSQLNIAITASGAYGSTIRQYNTALDGVNYISQAFTSNLINSSGTINAVVTVTDSRGRTATTTIPITIVDYAPPTITALSCKACNSNGTLNSSGLYTKVCINGTIAPVSNQNSKVLLLKYKEVSAVNYTEQAIALTNYAFETETIISNTDPAVTYEFVAVLTDKISNVSQSVRTAITALSFYAGGKGARFFGGDAEAEGLVVGNIDYTISDAEYQSLITQAGGVQDNTLHSLFSAMVNSPKVEIVKVWENASPESDFGAQTIPFDVTEYDYLFVNATQYGTRTGILKCVVGSALQLFTAEPQSGYAPMVRSRSFSIVDGGLSVKQGAIQRTNGTSMSSTNSTMIPYSIYGIKGVLPINV